MVDATIVGSGPNGLAAGIVLAQQGFDVKIFEAKDTIGGGTRTKELTKPGFKHDVCSAIHPAAVGAPFFKTLPLHDYGLEWIEPDIPLAHPFDNQPAAVLKHSLNDTASDLGADSERYKELFTPFVDRWDTLSPQLFAPLVNIPSTPLLMARFGLKGLRSAHSLAHTFKTDRAKGLLAGLSAHSMLPLTKMATASFGLLFGSIAHTYGWPLAKGGSQQIAHALASYFKSLGGVIETNFEVHSLYELPNTRVVLLDTSPRHVLKIAGHKLPRSYAKKLLKFKRGPGVFKVDFALDGPIPWKDDRCKEAGTVHLGGTFGEIAAAEQSVENGINPETPFVLVAQQSVFDETRAPNDKHVAWAYCHVPNGSTRDMRRAIVNQIERFAPGFKKRIIDKHSMNARQMYTYNPNYLGGDINGGRQDIGQLFKRPVRWVDPYHIPKTNVYICSASTPPGGGVHGMCGFHAAQSVLKRLN